MMPSLTQEVESLSAVVDEPALTWSGAEPLPVIPYFPRVIQDRMEPREPVLWTSGLPEHLQPYRLEDLVQYAVEHPEELFGFLGMDGYGINSWAVHYGVALPAGVVFVQARWGCAYQPEGEDYARKVASWIELAGELVRCLETGRPSFPSGRVVYVCDVFNGFRQGTVPPDGAAIEWRDGEEDLFARALSEMLHSPDSTAPAQLP